MAMRSALVSLAAAGAAVVLASGSAGACDGGRECFEKVRTPDLYGTIDRDVVVRPGRSEVVDIPAVTAVSVEPVEIAPGRVIREPVPPVYGTIFRRELVRPATAAYVTTPPLVRSVQETVVVSPGGYRWQVSRGPRGEVRKCRVPVRAVTKTIERQVVVLPGRRVPVFSLALYRDVARPVILREASVRSTYVPPQVAYVNRAVVVAPARRAVFQHPPVVETRSERVVVRHGGYAWQPVR